MRISGEMKRPPIAMIGGRWGMLDYLGCSIICTPATRAIGTI